MADTLLLRMKHLTKVFPGVTALDDVHFELKKGEVHVLLGENGAGKSTLVKIISGAYQKTSGEIFIDGQKIEIKNPAHAQQLGISTIYQELNLIPHLSVGENIFLGREPMQFGGLVDFKKLYAKSHVLLDQLGVSIDPKSLVKDLGIAQQQMVEVAKALSVESRILIMDEPTSALTDQEIAQLFSIIRNLKQRGVGIIYISHRLEELFEIGDRVTVLRDGKYIGTKNIEETNSDELIRMMVSRKLAKKSETREIKVGDEALRVENLSTEKLKNITFSVHRGEIVGIAGLLGSGRTELARAIFGADKFKSGKIFINQREIKLKSPRDSIKAGMGFLTEDRKTQGLILQLSVKENITLPSLSNFVRMGIIDSQKEKNTVSRFINELKIKTPGIQQKVVNLSGGNQQKVVISKWLCSNADILIFDEPTRGIDVASKAEIYQLMKNLASSGAAIVMISSELPEILRMSDRILVMQNGAISGEFTRGEATQEKILQYALGAAKN